MIINKEMENQNLHIFQVIKYSLGYMEDIMEILHVTRKGGMMNTLERFHIYNETKLDNLIKDKCTIKSNVIFDTIIQRNTSKGHSPL
jgi:hypothetical protein